MRRRSPRRLLGWTQQRLRDTRLFFQHALESEFREVIERLTGRVKPDGRRRGDQA